MAILSLLLGILPDFALHSLQAYLQATTSVTVEKEQTTRQLLLATVTGIVTLRQSQAAVVTAGMSHKVFWIPWLIAAVPASVWFAWGMIDSTFPGHISHVASLPPQLLTYFDVVFQNIFYAGAGMGAAQLIATAVASRNQ